jgi:hypothetical protein
MSEDKELPLLGKLLRKCAEGFNFDKPRYPTKDDIRFTRIEERFDRFEMQLESIKGVLKLILDKEKTMTPEEIQKMTKGLVGNFGKVMNKLKEIKDE